MSLLEIGQFLDLHVQKGPLKGRYQCQIVDMDARWLHVDLPINTENSIMQVLPLGTPVIVSFTDSRNTPCEFDSLVEANLFRKNHLLAIQRPVTEAIRRNQRREFVRVPVTIPVELLVMELGTNQIHTIQCTTQNLSGGGLSVILRHDHPIRKDDLVGVRLNLQVEGSNKEIISKARALNMQLSQEHRFRKYASFKFIDLHEHDRQLIIKYVFQRQIELRGRGLLGSALDDHV